MSTSLKAKEEIQDKNSKAIEGEMQVKNNEVKPTTPVSVAPSQHTIEVNESSNLYYNMIERKDINIFNEARGTQGICEGFNSDVERGLPSNAVAVQREKHGVNELPELEKVTICGLIIEGLKDRIMQILIVAAVVSIIIGMTVPDRTGHVNRATGWTEGTAILVSVTVVVLITAINDYKKAKKFEAMSAEHQKKQVDVVRDAKKVAVDVSELVVGDVLWVRAGMQLPADGVLIQGQDLKCDESAVTGETDIMKKSTQTDPFLISGTAVTEGRGTILIINVGVNSFAGKLAMGVRGTPADTPLQVKLGWLAGMIGKIGLTAALLLFVVLTIKSIVLSATDPEQYPWSAVEYLRYFVVAVTLVVVAIPEGLPLAVTIALAYSMREMMKDNCLVRVLASCETMGGTNTICSDKTGTLTTNSMTVVQGWLAEDHFVFDGYGVNGGAGAAVTRSGARDPEFHSKREDVDFLCEVLALGSTCEELEADGETVWVGGNKTEHGLINFVKRIGRDYQAIREPYDSSARRIYPFSSVKKRMTAIVRKDGKWLMLVKGASEMVLEDCNSVHSRTGAMVMDDEYRAAMMQTIQQMADQGNRTIGIAYAETKDLGDFPDEEPTYQMTMLAIAGIQDPIRQEVPAAVRNCFQAGISVRMVTGDNKNTAVAIAKKCGILSPEKAIEEGEVMEGAQFRAMAMEDPDKLISLIPKLRVLARSSPTDKLVLVACLMHEGDIVAVTGDGTNDAPALKMADVGFAMKTGTDVAVGASDMVLMDDNFSTVVQAATWGRTVNDNIRKFLQFQLTVNTAGVLLTVIGAIISEHNEEPLKPVQLLWLNLIMDTFAALSLATERPARDCLTKKGTGPISRAAPLISYRMWTFILGHALFQLAVLLVLMQLGHVLFDVRGCVRENVPSDLSDIKEVTDPWGVPRCFGGLEHGTVLFNTFIFMQLFNELNARKLHGEVNIFEGMHRSRILLVILVVCILFQFCAVQFFGIFMKTTPLNARQWGICVGIAAAELLVGLIVNLINTHMIPTWKPKTAEDNKKGLDDKKRALILEAKANAGMKRGVPGASDVHSNHSNPSPRRRSRRDSAVQAFAEQHPTPANPPSAQLRVT